MVVPACILCFSNKEQCKVSSLQPLKVTLNVDDPVKKPRSIVDVGCDIGGISRYVARKYGAECCGITLSPVQAERAQALPAAQGLGDKVVENVNSIIGPALIGKNPAAHTKIDNFMVQELDGTINEWGLCKQKFKRCGEMACKLRFFRDQMMKAGLLASTRFAYGPEISLDELEVKLGELESELIEMNANTEKLQRAYNELLEYKLVLQKAGDFFHYAQNSATAQQREFEEHRLVEGSMDSPLLLEQEMTTEISEQVKLGYVSGLVPRDKTMVFERILFRTTRGNVFLKQNVVDEPAIDPVQGDKVVSLNSFNIIVNHLGYID